MVRCRQSSGISESSIQLYLEHPGRPDGSPLRRSFRRRRRRRRRRRLLQPEFARLSLSVYYDSVHVCLYVCT